MKRVEKWPGCGAILANFAARKPTLATDRGSMRDYWDSRRRSAQCGQWLSAALQYWICIKPLSEYSANSGEKPKKRFGHGGGNGYRDCSPIWPEASDVRNMSRVRGGAVATLMGICRSLLLW